MANLHFYKYSYFIALIFHFFNKHGTIVLLLRLSHVAGSARFRLFTCIVVLFTRIFI